jgi:hypothetical protein
MNGIAGHRQVFLSEDSMKPDLVFERQGISHVRRQHPPAPLLGTTMLQSTIFSDLHAIDRGTGSNHAVHLLPSGSRKGSFARLMQWPRALFSRDDLQGLSNRLLRDIGASDQVGESSFRV